MVEGFTGGRRGGMKTKSGKIVVILVILMWLSSSVAANMVFSFLAKLSKPLMKVIGEKAKKISSPKTWLTHHIKEDFMKEKGEHTRAVVYLLLLAGAIWQIDCDITKNIEDYVLVNPDPYQSGLNSALNFFILILIPTYVLAIVLVGVYLLFLSASSKGRARAKSMLSKLVIGVVLLSISPWLLGTFFSLSTAVTRSILDQGKDAEVDMAVGTYMSTMWESYMLTVQAIAGTEVGNMFMTTAGKGYGDVFKESSKKLRTKISKEVTTGFTVPGYTKTYYLGKHRIPLRGAGNLAPKNLKWEVAAHKAGIQHVLKDKEGRKLFRKMIHSQGFGRLLGKLKMVADPARTIPMLMVIVMLFAGLYGLLAFRYLMTMFFALLFPFTIFFLSFDPMKKLGGTLLEQTLLWTILQEFFAITLIAVGMGMMMLSPDLLGYGIFGGFFNIAACITLIMGPLILFMMFRKLLPPL